MKVSTALTNISALGFCLLLFLDNYELSKTR